MWTPNHLLNKCHVNIERYFHIRRSTLWWHIKMEILPGSKVEEEYYTFVCERHYFMYEKLFEWKMFTYTSTYIVIGLSIYKYVINIIGLFSLKFLLLSVQHFLRKLCAKYFIMWILIYNFFWMLCIRKLCVYALR